MSDEWLRNATLMKTGRVILNRCHSYFLHAKKYRILFHYTLLILTTTYAKEVGKTMESKL